MSGQKLMLVTLLTFLFLFHYSIQDVNKVDAGDDLVAKFQEFCTLAGSKDKTLMTSKASGKLVAECFEKGYKKYNVKYICDTSVFPALKEREKPHMIVNKANVDKYITKTAHEIAKRKTMNTKIAGSDPEVTTIKADLALCVSACTGLSDTVN